MQNRMKRIKLTIHTIILLVLVSFICVAQSNEQKCSLSETPDLLKDEKGKPITITPSEMGKRFISGEKPEYPGDCRCQGAVYFLLHITEQFFVCMKVNGLNSDVHCGNGYRL